MARVRLHFNVSTHSLLFFPLDLIIALSFGGFLLLAGVLSDRLGRRFMFTGGMLWMMVFSIACGVSRTGVQCIIFRALQGLGAAASVPSAIGVLSTFFVGNERHRALSMFGAAGAVGFVVGLILGGEFLAL